MSVNAGDLPETMFRTTTFDDSTDEVLRAVKFSPLDEAAEDEWYADWEPITVEVTDEKERVFHFDEDEHLNVWVDRD